MRNKRSSRVERRQLSFVPSRLLKVSSRRAMPSLPDELRRQARDYDEHRRQLNPDDGQPSPPSPSLLPTDPASDCSHERSQVLHPHPPWPPLRLDPDHVRRSHPLGTSRQWSRRQHQRLASLLLHDQEQAHCRHVQDHLLVCPLVAPCAERGN